MYYLTEEGKKFLNEDADKFRRQMIFNRAFYRFKKGLPPAQLTRRDKSQIEQQVNYQKIIDAQRAARKKGQGGT